MDPRPTDPRAGALTDLEAKLLAAAVGKRLFKNSVTEPVALGRYRLIEKIGRGGMGVVFRAHDPQLRRDVAVKLLHADRGGREQHARLRREALALGRLSHPNVVQVFEVGEVDEHMFVAMELVRGSTLRAWLADRPRSVAEVVAMVLQVGRGLAAAHAAGIVHRDLKPDNVLVGEDGRARVVDFGLARAAVVVDGAAGSLEVPLTKTGALLGTPAFMAPEQVRDPTRADARADQFSYCVLVYEALYGERPFADVAAAEAGAMRAAPAGTSVPTAVRGVLARGLMADPARRWGSIDELLVALEEAVVGERAPRRIRWPWIAGGVMVFCTLVVVLGWQARGQAARQEERLAGAVRRLTAMIDDPVAAERVLASMVEDMDDMRAAASAWSSYATSLAGAGRSSRSAWAHAFVLGHGEAAVQQDALRGLARDPGADAAEVRALIAEQAPELLAEPEVAALHTASPRGDVVRDAAEVAEEVRALEQAKAPPEVIALARVGLFDLAASTLRTLADHADPSTRRTWLFALVPLVDEEQALVLLAAAAAEPALQDDAALQTVQQLLADGRLAEARTSLTPLLELPGEVGQRADALQERLTTILDARVEVPLRFVGAPWTELEPSLLRGDPTGQALGVDGMDGATIAAWSLELVADRAIVEVDVTPRCLAAGSSFVVRASRDEAAEVGLGVADGRLRMRCGEEVVTVGEIAEEARQRRTLQLDVDGRGGVTCRVRDPQGRTTVRAQAERAGVWTPGPLRLELRGDAGDPACAHVEVSRVAVIGARAVGGETTALARAGALLVDDDPHAAALALEGLAGARARLWQAVALGRVGRWQDGALQLQQALAGDAGLEAELRRFVRVDEGLAPALRQMLGERAYLGLIARTWETAVAAEVWSPALVRRVLRDTGGLVTRCEAEVCASLLRARGRALVQVNEPAAAQQALAAALAAAPADAAGRALASQILVELTLVKAAIAEAERVKVEQAKAGVEVTKPAVEAARPEVTKAAVEAARPEVTKAAVEAAKPVE